MLYAMDYPYQFVPEEVKVTDDLADQRRGQKEALPDQRGASFSTETYHIDCWVPQVAPTRQTSDGEGGAHCLRIFSCGPRR